MSFRTEESPQREMSSAYIRTPKRLTLTLTKQALRATFGARPVIVYFVSV